MHGTPFGQIYWIATVIIEWFYDGWLGGQLLTYAALVVMLRLLYMMLQMQVARHLFIAFAGDVSRWQALRSTISPAEGNHFRMNLLNLNGNIPLWEALGILSRWSDAEEVIYTNHQIARLPPRPVHPIHRSATSRTTPRQSRQPHTLRQGPPDVSSRIPGFGPELRSAQRPVSPVIIRSIHKFLAL
jgi:hypothetical protein